MRKICGECKEPIMIINGIMVSPIGSTDIVQVITYGCLNDKCSQYKVIVDKTEDVVIQE